MSTVIAGIGNIFNRDDGFGCAVAQRLTAREMPTQVRVEDYGIRGMHLALDLLDGCDLLVLVDAWSAGEPPGTVSLLEPDTTRGGPPVDAHALDPQAVLAMVAGLGGRIGRVLVVGCEPRDLGEGIGLSPEVERSVPTAVAMIQALIEEEERTVTCVD